MYIVGIFVWQGQIRIFHSSNYETSQNLFFYRDARRIRNHEPPDATSPFRTAMHVNEALKLYSPDIDMVVSVKETSSNPYYNCFEEDGNGFLKISKGDGNYTRRQDVPKVYEYNGAIYIINPNSLKTTSLGNLTKRVKYVMDDLHSLDLDNKFFLRPKNYFAKLN